MPIEFLSQEQRERYGRFVEDPTSTQPTQYFLLGDRSYKRSPIYQHSTGKSQWLWKSDQ